MAAMTSHANQELGPEVDDKHLGLYLTVGRRWDLVEVSQHIHTPDGPNTSVFLHIVWLLFLGTHSHTPRCSTPDDGKYILVSTAAEVAYKSL